jgi:signal peptidase II
VAPDGYPRVEEASAAEEYAGAAPLKGKLGAFAGTAVTILALDILTKYLISSNLSYSDRIPMIEGFFYLTHVTNTGGAFGLFRDAPVAIRRTFFIGISGVAIAIILQFFRKLAPGDRLSAFALGLILAGAVGNLIDRIRLGEVVDFLHFVLWGGYAWPDFNLADTWIVVGVSLIVLELLASEGEERTGIESGEPGG